MKGGGLCAWDRWGMLTHCVLEQDKKKIPAAEPIFTLAAADLVETARPMTHIAQHLPSLR